MEPGGIAALRATVVAGERSPEEVVAEHLERIEAAEPGLGAFALLDRPGALREARRLAGSLRAGRPPGQLHGVPFAVKDSIDLAGLPTRANSWTTRGDLPARADAAVVAALRRAGAIPLGKLTLQELGEGADEDATPWPPARNPWDRDRTAGGSSSGSGAAVAAGLVPLAIGTDTGGSVRLPAAMCGVVGLKPTFGRVDLRGVMPLAPSLDHVGWLTGSAADAELVLAALVPGLRLAPAKSADLTGVRIGVVRHFFERDAPADAEVRAAIDAALCTLEGLGAEVEEVGMRPLAAYHACAAPIFEFEAGAAHGHRLTAGAGPLGDTFRSLLERAAKVSSERYESSIRLRATLRAEADELLRARRLDLLVTAVTPGPAWRIGDADAARRLGDGAQRMAFNLLGYPALSLPVGRSAGGLPLAMQLAAPRGDELCLLRAARAFQTATSWHRECPSCDPLDSRDDIDV